MMRKVKKRKRKRIRKEEVATANTGAGNHKKKDGKEGGKDKKREVFC
ncbi:hypothetical protein QIU19_05600 [Capnocytophaga canimorsus]|nr:hypothetical protein [Capnocytophaga canimorsus]WGU69227.1 hypothetical protein QIU19_05600 [Capnocytophaga canimorsus]